VLTIGRDELAMETLGMSLSEGKAMLSAVQDVVIEQQAHEYLEQQGACSDCVVSTRIRMQGTHSSKRSLAQCKWRTDAGIAARVRAMVPIRFGPCDGGCKETPVRRCCIWKRSGHP
jgi:hypothetical protein